MRLTGPHFQKAALCAAILMQPWSHQVALGQSAGKAKASAQATGGKAAAAKAPARNAAATWTFSVEAMPAWISTPPSVDLGALAQAPGYMRELSDHQIKLDAEGESHFVRQRLRINDVTGLETASQVNVTFSPDVARLAFHDISIIRGGQRINMLDRNKVRWLQREAALEEQMIDGEVTASLILEDLRVGDVVEYAYTLKGANPVFGGRYSALMPTSHPRPTGLFQYRLVAPDSRHFVVAPNENFQVIQSSKGGLQELIVQRRQVESKVREPFSPRISDLELAIQVTEFKDWHDVAGWAQGLFKQAYLPSEAVKAQVERLRAPDDTPEKLTEKILDFVQQDIRYFGTEVGVNTHQPATPEQVIRQRFGDCKDKVSLLVAMLQAAGIEAVPVLVSSQLRGDVERLIPSSAAFNHVVARVKLGEQVHWFDATAARQRGPLAERQAQRFNRGLVLSPSTTELSVMPDGQNQLMVEAKDTVTVTAMDQPATLQSTTRHFEDRAGSLRGLRATLPRAALARYFESEYRERYGIDVKLLDEPVISEVADHNAVDVTLRFSLAEPLDRAGSTFSIKPQLFRVADALRLPSKLPRQAPYLIGSTGRYIHEFSIELPDTIWTEPAGRRYEDQGDSFRLKFQVRQEGKRSVVRSELAVQADRIEPAKIDDFRRHWGNGLARHFSSVNWAVLTPVQAEQNDVALRGILTEQIRQNRIYRYADLARIRNLSAYIDSGRLNSRLTAAALSERADAYMDEGEYTKAIADFRASLQRRPDQGYLRLGLGRSLFLAGDIDASLKTLTEAMADAPDATEARRLRAMALYLTGQPAKAKAELLSLLEDSPQESASGVVHNWIRLCMIQLKEPLESMPQLAITAKPKSWAHAMSQFALGKMSAEDFEKASKDSALKGIEPGDRALQRQLFLGLQAIAESKPSSGRDMLEAVSKGRLSLESSIAKHALKN